MVHCLSHHCHASDPESRLYKNYGIHQRSHANPALWQCAEPEYTFPHAAARWPSLQFPKICHSSRRSNSVSSLISASISSLHGHSYRSTTGVVRIAGRDGTVTTPERDRPGTAAGHGNRIAAECRSVSGQLASGRVAVRDIYPSCTAPCAYAPVGKESPGVIPGLVVTGLLGLY